MADATAHKTPRREAVDRWRNSRSRRLLAWAAVALACLSLLSPAGAQDPPNRPLSIEVPEAWVYHVRTHINGPTLLFEALTGENEMRVSPDLATPIVTVTALASATYQREAQDAWWDGVAARTDDTVFVWTVHGLDHAFKADVPRVIESIKVIALD